LNAIPGLINCTQLSVNNSPEIRGVHSFDTLDHERSSIDLKFITFLEFYWVRVICADSESTAGIFSYTWLTVIVQRMPPFVVSWKTSFFCARLADISMEVVLAGPLTTYRALLEIPRNTPTVNIWAKGLTCDKWPHTNLLTALTPEPLTVIC
jgi:hypothetical protein